MIGQIIDVVDEIYIDVSNKVANKKLVSGKKFTEIENFEIKGSYIGNLNKSSRNTLNRRQRRENDLP
jgi:hypothetical protein